MIPLIKSTFYKERRTKELLCSFIKRADKLSFSRECEGFEEKLAVWQGRKHCVLVNSGSSANLAIIQALLNLGRLKKGDKVGFSAVTWSTNVMPLIQLGLDPVPVDVELDTLNVSAEKLAKRLRSHRIRALFLTHLLGFCDDLDALVSLCRKENIIIIEDTCESIGSVYRGRKLGNFGLAGTFSFYVGHHMSTIEGGAVCTDDEDVATMLRLVRAHGWDRNLSYGKQEAIRKKFHVNSTFYSRYTFYDLGYNLRPTEITGYLGARQLEYLDTIIRSREKNFKTLASRIYSGRRFFPVRSDHMDVVSNFAVPLICRSRSIRDECVEKCANKVEIRPIVGGDMNTQPFFRKYFNNRYPDCVNSKIIHSQGFYFGNNPELTHADIRTLLAIFS